MRAFLVAGCLLSVSYVASAGQEFECGGARVEVRVASGSSNSLGEDARSTVAVTRERLGRELSYIGGIDFVGGHCLSDAAGRLMVVFQAYCGGSGCSDLNNWGIVDPRSLQVLLAPSDSNLGDAKRVLGRSPVAPKAMLNVQREIEKGQNNALQPVARVDLLQPAALRCLYIFSCGRPAGCGPSAQTLSNLRGTH
jgi:hypothetical protein